MRHRHFRAPQRRPGSKSVRLSGLLVRLMTRVDGWWEAFAARLRARIAQQQQQQRAAEPAARMQFEPFEPRILMSADLLPAATTAPGQSEAAEHTQVQSAVVVATPLATDADGTQIGVVFSGPGSASLTAQGTGFVLGLTGTDATSRISLDVQGGDGRVALTGIDAATPLAALDLSQADLAGDAHFSAAVGSLSLGRLTGASLMFDAVGNVALKVGTAVDSQLHAPQASVSLIASSWNHTAAGSASIEAAALTAASVTGDLATDLRLSGTGIAGYVLGTVQVGGAVSGIWSVHGRASAIVAGSTGADWHANISGTLLQFVTRGDASGLLAAAGLQVLQVGGSARGLTLMIGADLGDDAALGGGNDTFRAGTLGRLRVAGDVHDSRILVGVDPVNGVLGDGDDVLRGTASQRITEVTVGGQLSGATRIVAPAFPVRVSVGGSAVDPATLPVLSSTPKDTTAPVVALALADDSGTSAIDRLTGNPAVLMTILEAGVVQTIQLRLGSSAFQTTALTRRSDGSYLLDGDVLRALNGGSDLPDGAVHLEARATDAAGNVSATATLDFTLDTQTPGVAAALVHDTGASAADGLTTDAVVGGTVGGAGTRLLTALDPASASTTLIDVSDALAGSGAFTLAAARLAALAGGTLTDGVHVLRLVAEDAAGNRSTAVEVAFTLDTQAPAVTGLGLAAASDTGTLGDLMTQASTVTLVGRTEPGRTVGLSFGTESRSAVADGNGDFAFANVALALGANAFTVSVTDAAGNTASAGLSVERTPVVATDTTAPTLTAALATDTGASASDGITRSAAVSGTAGDNVGVTRLLAVLDPTTATPVFTDVSSALGTGGAFTLSAARLAALAGGTLADGAHVLRLVAEDAAGNRSAAVDVAFTLDTQAPGAASFALATVDALEGDDTRADAAIVALRGNADPGATVTLAAQNLSTVASQTGAFTLAGVALALGDNALTVTVADAAGNSSTVTQTLTRVAQTQADEVLNWNQLALEAIKADATPPSLATRLLAMQSVAVYDTLAAIDGTPAFMVQKSVTGPVSADAAVVQAAYEVLHYVYPAQRASLKAELDKSLAKIAGGVAKNEGILLGTSIAEAILVLRETDGYRDFMVEDGSDQPGVWRLTAPLYAVAENPQWADLTPFALASGDAFRAPAFPALDSAEYAAAMEQVRLLGSATGSTRTADQTQQAHFWADGMGSYTPPGHWNLIANQVAAEKGNGLAANARLMAQLNVALADAAIACWETKYTFLVWRPIDAIHLSDQDGNAATVQDESWRPLLITPAHPSYVSGHSTFSAAAADILAAAFGDAVSFTTTSPTLPGVTRSFTSFDQAADEAGLSRIYGGIHTSLDNEQGAILGRKVADAVLAKFALQSDTQAPTVIAGDTAEAVKGNLTLAGQVLDNLSGVAGAQWKLDDGALQTLAFDADGRFSLTTALRLDGSQDGEHVVTIVARDAAGNLNAGHTRAFTLDTRAPTLTLASLADGAALDAASRLTGSADATGSSITSLRYVLGTNAGRTLVFDAATGGFDEALALGDLPTGSHTLTLQATDAAGNSATLTRTVTLADLPLLTIARLSPVQGADDVGVTQRPRIFFSRAVDTSTLTADSFWATGPDGSRLAATVVPAQDGTFAWLFPADPMPGGSTITLHLDGDRIRAANGGALLDADGDGNAGGLLAWSFTTASRAVTPTVTVTDAQGNATVVSTRIVGKVVDPGPDLLPMTFDDIRRGDDGVIHTGDDVFRYPIEHAKVWVLGQEDRFVYTNDKGEFELSDVPTGTVRLAIDGRTATNPPEGVFFPEMVMELIIEPGVDNTVMGSMGTAELQRANEDRKEVYLPRVADAIWKDVEATGTTSIGLPPQASSELTQTEQELVKLEVAAGSLLDAEGRPLANPQVGISLVPPELIRDMLPPGTETVPITFTIQAPGAVAFATPLSLTVPNVYGAAPGEKLNFYSFDHETGRMVVEGTATVSADGLSVTTDEGQGITKPGWHGFLQTIERLFGFFGDALREVGESANALWELGSKLVEWASSVVDFGIGVVTELIRSDDWAEAWQKSLDDIGDEIRERFPALTRLEQAAITATENARQVLKWIGNTLGVLDVAGSVEDLFKTIGQYRRGEVGWQELALAAADTAVSIGSMLPAGRVLKAALLIGDLALDAYKSLPEIGEAAKKLADQLRETANAVGQVAETTRQAAAEAADALDRWFENASQQLDSYISTFDGLDRLNEQIESLFPNPSTPPASPEALDSLLEDIGSWLPRSRSLPHGDQPSTDPRPSLPHERIPVWLEPLIPGGTGFASQNLAATFIDAIARDYGQPISEEPSPIWKITGINANLTGSGPIIDVNLPPNQTYKIDVFDPKAKVGGSTTFTTKPGETQRMLPRIAVGGGNLPDLDGDGIPDQFEAIYGTLAGRADSDGDGISDLAEILSGSDPLGGRALPTGVISSVTLRGEATSIALTGDIDSSSSQTAYVATGSYGLAIVDASQFRTPVVRSQLELQGQAIDVAVDGNLNVAAVAAGSAGLHLIDVADATAPRLLQTLALNAGAVEVQDGIAYVATGAELRAYDLLTGERLATLGMPSRIQALAREGDTLFVLDAGHELHAVQIDHGTLVARDALEIAGSPTSLFVGGGIAYVGMGDARRQGFATVNVSDPGNLRLLSDADDLTIVSGAMAANGSGLLVTAGAIIGVTTTFNAIDVVNVRNPADTAARITRITLPEVPLDIAIGAGIAFIADGSGGLQVVNYLSADNRGTAPAVNGNVGALDVDPATPGIQVLEGSIATLRPTTTDDVQVRNVELLRDGQVVANDVGFPFELSTALPTLAANGGNGTVTLQLRATDTGGNVGTTAPVTINLVRDTFAPTLVSGNVTEGTSKGRSFRAIDLVFSEAMDPATLNASTVQLIGPDGQSVAPANFQIRQQGRELQVTYSPLARTGAYELRLLAPSITDRAGNALGTATLVTRFTVKSYTAEWIGPASGFWDVASNWSTGVVPGAGDDVFVGLPTGSTVTVRAGTATVATLTSDARIVVTGGSLSVTGESLLRGGLRMTGGAFDPAGGGAIVGGLQMSGGTFTADAALDIDTLSLADGTFTGTGAVAVAAASTWSGGAITGTGTLSFNGDLSIAGTAYKILTGGRVINTLGTTVWSGATSADTNDFYTGPATINNSGTWIDDNAFSTLVRDYYGGSTLVFNNSGIYRKLATSTSTLQVTFNNTGTLDVRAGVLNLERGGTAGAQGSFNIEPGATLRLGNGTFMLDDTVVTGSGRFQVAGFYNSSTNVVHTGTTTVAGELSLVGGTLSANGTFNAATYSHTGNDAYLVGTGTVNVAGAATWSDGAMTGTGTINFQGDLAITGSAYKIITGGRVVNTAGTTTWSGATSVNTNDFYTGPATINNSGIWIDGNAFDTVMRDWYGGGALVFNNTGTYRKVGAGTPTLELVFNNTGTLDVQAGVLSLSRGGMASSQATINIEPAATLRFNVGTFTVDGTPVTGTGRFQVAGTFNETTNVVHTGTTTLAAELSLVGGTLTANGTLNATTYSQTAGYADLAGTGTVNVSGAAIWSDGNMLGTGTINFNGDLAISGAADKAIYGGRVINTLGTTTWSGATSANTNDFYTGPATINNKGTWIDGNAFGTVMRDWFGGSTLVFNNSGTYRKIGASTSTLELVFNNTGTLDVQGGVLSLSRGGSAGATGSINIEPAATLRFNTGTFALADTVVTGTGRFQVAGTFNDTTSVVHTGTTTLAGELSLTGGTLTANGTLNAATYLQTASYADLAGTGTVNVSGAATWSDGNMLGTGTINFNGDLAIAGAADKAIYGGRVINTTGTTTWSGATAANTNDFYTGPGTINNKGTWIDGNAFSTVMRDWFGGSTLVFNNTGTYRKAGAGTSTLELVFNNTGTLDVQAGVLSLGRGGTASSQATINIEPAATLRFNTGSFALDGTPVTGTGRFQVAGTFNDTTNVVHTGTTTLAGELSLVGGTLTANGTLSAATYSQTANYAFLAGTGTVNVAGAATWSDGNMLDTGTITFNGNLAISGAADKAIYGGRVINTAGTTTWSGATEANTNDFYTGPGTINNTGTWIDGNVFSTVIRDWFGGSALVFNNSGTYRKVGNTTSTLQVQFNNSGTVDVQAGLLNLSRGGNSSGEFRTAADSELAFLAGTQVWTAGARSTGTGTISVRNQDGSNGGTLQVNTDVTVQRLNLGPLGVLSGSGTLTLTGTGNQWAAGLMTGGGTTVIAAGADLTLSGDGRKYLGNRTIVNNGTLVEASTGDRVDLEGTAVLVNNATFDIRSDTAWQDATGAAGSLTLDNTGTVQRTAGSAQFEFLGTALNNTGLVSVQTGMLAFGGSGGSSSGEFRAAAGTEIVFLAGTQTWNTGAKGTGAGAIAVRNYNGSIGGTLSVAGNAEMARLNLGALGELSGSGTLALVGTGSQWTAGLITGGGTTTIAAGADLTLSGDGRKHLGNRTLVNDGTLVEASTGDRVDLEGTAVLTNNGTFDIRSDTAWQDATGAAGSLTLDNTGTVRRTAGTGQFEFLGTALSNSGLISVETGTLAFGGSGGSSSGEFRAAAGTEIVFLAGTQTWTSGARGTGAGAVAVRNYNGSIGGTLIVAGSAEMARLNLGPLGVLSGSGTLTLTGTDSQWTSGLMTGGGTTVIAAGAGLTLSGDGRKHFGNRTIVNNGTLVEASTGGWVDLEGTAVLTNNGIFDIRSDTAWRDFSGAGGSLTLDNAGTLRKSAGTGDFFFLNTTFNNTGTVQVQTGRIRVNNVFL